MKSNTLIFILLSVLWLAGCGSDDVQDVQLPPVVTDGDYVIFAWNDLGMHCANPTYEDAVILPPYNTIQAQVVLRDDPPRVVTTGLRVSYRILNNTTSYGKTDIYGGHYAQFWDNAEALFGIILVKDTGLNLVDADRHNGLSGDMVVSGDHFRADGIPLTPVDDAGTWNPYQVAEISVYDAADKLLARTRTTAPVSDEINCAKCHAAGINPDDKNAFANILALHDQRHQTTLVADKPVLCARCHSSPALGGSTTANRDMYLSSVIHRAHDEANIGCYDCHPGDVTHCNRSLRHTSSNGNCTACHGTIAQVGSTIAAGSRVPWVNEPACVTCHNGVTGVDTGTTLYRNATGHGGLFCPACHGSPHAMVPSSVASDNYQALQYQNKALTLGSCAVCHGNSRGEGSGEFAETHGGGRRESACNICHTAVSGSVSRWPHAFTWKSR